MRKSPYFYSNNLNEERSYINVFIPIHRGCEDRVILNKNVNSQTIVGKGGTKDGIKEPSERQLIIIGLIKEDGTLTTKKLAQKAGLSLRTLMRELASLQKMGILNRDGGRKEGKWEIIEKNTGV